MKKILLLGILIVLIAGCGVPNQVAPSTQNYECEEYGYAITAPAGWIVAEAPDCIVSLLGIEDDLFLNVVVSVQDTDLDIASLMLEELDKLERSELYVDTNVLNVGTNNIEFTYFMGEQVHANMELYVSGGHVYAVVRQAYETEYYGHETELAAIADTFRFI